jgi:hypothetical protein
MTEPQGSPPPLGPVPAFSGILPPARKRAAPPLKQLGWIHDEGVIKTVRTQDGKKQTFCGICNGSVPASNSTHRKTHVLRLMTGKRLRSGCAM